MTLSRLRRDELEAQNKLDATRALLRDATQLLEETRAEMGDAQETTAVLEKKAALATQNLAALHTEYMSIETELCEVEEERDILKQEIADYTTKLAQVKQHTESLEKDLSILRYNAQLVHDAYENTMTQQATQQSAKEREILTLNAEIAQLEAKHAVMTQEIESHATNMRQDKKRINEEWEKIKEREDVVDRRAEDARMLRARLKNICAENKIVFPIADE
jgi:chromosome segregation ATPase